MTDRLNIALAQLNPHVGDVRGNARKILAARETAQAQDADLVVCAELAITGYPPEDLVRKPFFQSLVEREVETLATATKDGGPALLVGAPWRDGENLHNAVLLIDDGRIAAVRHKRDLPNYGPFDEKRVFCAGGLPDPIEFRGVRLGAPICEDLWTPAVAGHLAKAGAEILLAPNASPYETDKADQRRRLAEARASETGLPVVYVNQVGGQDELAFDGASFVIGADLSLRVQAPAWREDVALTRWSRDADGRWVCAEGDRHAPPAGLPAIWQAMTLGLRDYVNKNGFPGVILGLSGGIDSAVSAAVAVDALGPERVRCAMLPSPYTSRESLEDAAEVARMLGVRLDEISIGPAMAAFAQMTGPFFEGLPADIAEENIQSRARGVTLMALSNKFGHMVLSTGNKSEMSVGYATLYGDMCGGYSVLKDVYKTTVFELARWRNAHRPDGALGGDGPVMPERVIVKPPSAELKPDQTDQDTLPPYDVLDDILECLIEREMGVEEIAARGHDQATINRVWRMLDRAEYKRRQAPPGVKITRRSFGKDRRYPITNAFVNLLV